MALAVGSFILSYTALFDIAKNAIVPDWQWLWPLIIDGSIVVFGLTVVYFGLIKHNYVVPLVLVLLFTLITVIFNAIHAGKNGLAITVGIMPPLSLFFSFTVCMWMLRNGIERKWAADSLQDIIQQARQKQGELDDIGDRLKTEHDRLATLQQTRHDTIRQLDEQITTRRVELATLERHPVVLLGVDPDTLPRSPDIRRTLVRQLEDITDSDPTISLTQHDKAAIFGITERTYQRDVQSFNDNSGNGQG